MNPTTCAVMQTSAEPPTMEQLRTAYRTVPGVPAVDADRLCQDMFGVLARNLKAEQATALQAGLRSQGIETEVVEESALPPLPPAKTLRRLEFTPEAMMVFDPLGRAFPVEWGHVMLIAAGSVQQAAFQRTRQERETVRTKFVHGVIPVQVREVKVAYTSSESAERVLRGEIILTRGAARYSLEAENFNYAGCLGERVTKEVPVDFCTLMRELIKHAPQAILGRGAATIMAESAGFVRYMRMRSLEEELTWMRWKLAEQ
jgi:hypothetical protein